MLISMSIVIAACLVVIAVYEVTRPRTTALTSPRGEPVMAHVAIICGDCAGYDPVPVKTYLKATGRCSQCDGSSYQLAAHRGLLIELERLRRTGAACNYEREVIERCANLTEPTDTTGVTPATVA